MNPQGSRPTIGLIHQVMFNEQPVNVFQGVADVAREQEMNLLCFSGGAFRHPDRFFWSQGSIIYELRRVHLDGIIIASSLVGSHVEFAEIDRFCRRYQPAPIVSLGLELEGIPSVMLDNYPGMYATVSHLIEAHGYRRIAFICGPAENLEAQARHRAYCDALQAHGIALDAELIAPGNFTPASGVEAVKTWFDEKGWKPGGEIEAIATANDHVAIAVFGALQRRGIYAPRHIGIVGFDDMRWGEERNPFLTTARQPFYAMGCRAAELLCAQLRGEPCQQRVMLPAQMVVRQSCGCFSALVAQANAAPVAAHGAFNLQAESERAALIAEMAQAVGGKSRDEALAAELLASLTAFLRDRRREKFLQTLTQILSQAAAAADDSEVLLWQNALSIIRRVIFPALASDERLRVEDLWQQARIVIGEFVGQSQGLKMLRNLNRAFGLRAFRTAIIAAENLESFLNVLAEELPQQGITAAYLALYEQPQPYQYPQPAPEWSRLMLAYDAETRYPLPPDGERFPSAQVLPEAFWPQAQTWQRIIIPLYFQEIQLGFIVFAPHPRDHLRYESLRIDLCIALREVLLLEENHRHQAELERLVNELQHALADLQRTQAQLVHAEKMAALGKLIANIAHEINTPIGAIRASASNIVTTLEQTLDAIPEMLRRLSADQQAAFLTLIRRACQPKASITSREERQHKRALIHQLESRGLASADMLADMLVDMGIYDAFEPFLTLAELDQADSILKTAAQLVSQRHNSDNILTAVERVSKIVFALKSYAHSNPSGDRVMASITEGMDVVLTLYYNHLKHGVEVIKHYAPVPTILCYPDELNQVWTNLIHNAIQSMQGKGRLEIAVTTVETHGRASLQSGILVEITDSGPGIPDAIKERIFEPFFTTKPAGEGSGLGLDICKKIIDKHHGKIDFDSQPGRTTFRVWLPMLTQANKPSS